MSKMSEVYIDILDMLERGDRPIKISVLLDIPVEMVYDVLETMPAQDKIATEVGKIG